MKKIFLVLVFFLIIYTIALSNNDFLPKVNALIISYPSYEVNVYINKDTTFLVEEVITSKINGFVKGVIRDIPILDYQKRIYCINNPQLTCGGFELLLPIGIFDEYDNKTENSLVYIYQEGSEGQRFYRKFLRFQQTLWEEGRYVENYVHKWKIKYKVIGGIQNNIFYWNMAPKEKSNLESFSYKIEFPSDIKIDLSNFNRYSTQQGKLTIVNNSIYVDIPKGIDKYDSQTVSYQFSKNDLYKTYPLKILINPDNSSFLGAKVLWNNFLLDDKNASGVKVIKIKNFPIGNHNFEITRQNYENIRFILKIPNFEIQKDDNKYNYEANVYQSSENNEIYNVVEIKGFKMKEDISTIYNILSITFLLIGCISTFLVPVMLLVLYKLFGIDKNPIKTIIPTYSPPENIKPYLLGSIKDEKVDPRDIVGSIIDLCYRGYIKIKSENNNKNYILIRTEKENTDLDEIEILIIESIFSGDEKQINIRELEGKWYKYYKKIKQQIYSLMVKKGFFKTSPELVRSFYIVIGITLFLFFGSFTSVVSSVLSEIFGILMIFTPFLFFSLLGIGLIIISRYMPAKTPLGSKIYSEILGFKMFLSTTDKYRLQRLQPEEFEEYLSYAIVLEVEKEWAKKFEGIYNKIPNWIDGNFESVYINTLFVSNLLNNFYKISTTSLITRPRGIYGSGWIFGGTSSGGFKGFSGGGGGGGRVGGW